MKRDSSSLLHISHFTELILAIHPFMLSLGLCCIYSLAGRVPGSAAMLYGLGLAILISI